MCLTVAAKFTPRPSPWQVVLPSSCRFAWSLPWDSQFRTTGEAFFWRNLPIFWACCLLLLPFAALGLLDDLQLLRGRHKLIGQVGAIGILIAFGVRIPSVYVLGTDIDLGLFAIPVTVIWLLGAINALNLIDGMDGLLCTVGFLVTAAMATMAILLGRSCPH